MYQSPAASLGLMSDKSVTCTDLPLILVHPTLMSCDYYMLILWWSVWGVLYYTVCQQLVHVSCEGMWWHCGCWLIVIIGVIDLCAHVCTWLDVKHSYMHVNITSWTHPHDAHNSSIFSMSTVMTFNGPGWAIQQSRFSTSTSYIVKYN